MTRPDPSVQNKSPNKGEDWSYLALEPREVYDEALLGVLPLESVSEVEEEEITHVALYCRTKVLILLSREIMSSELSWEAVLQDHYLNQDSASHPPFPMYVDPPEGWEGLESGRWVALWKELSEELDRLPSSEPEPS